MSRFSRSIGSLSLAALLTVPVCADDAQEDLVAELAKMNTDVFGENEQEQLSSMLGDDIRIQRDALNELDRQAWERINSRSGWETFARHRIDLLEQSLGLPAKSDPVTSEVLGRIQGEGFVIEKIVYTSRPGMWITANLYRPNPPRASMPGILISHSHHRPKTQGEIQDMGMTWARAGCLVLAPDHLGHGERQQHGFGEASDFDGEFPVSRQDYYFRYDTGIQLHLAGESLIGQFVYDLQRGVSLLLEQEGIAPENIIVLGAVAGGAEPAAVAAAIDQRIACVCPFNFGGPQMPGRRYPLPEDIAETMNYIGSGSWESTRNLRRSGSDGFPPWMIVASIAPRRLIYAHEFAWHRQRDPIWARLEKIYGWYDASENLGYTHGRGDVKLRPPAATHCTQIGLEHRQMIHPLLNKWFGIEVSAETEYSARLEESELLCFDEKTPDLYRSKPLHQILLAETEERHDVLREKLAGMSRAERRRELRKRWTEALRVNASALSPTVVDVSRDSHQSYSVERFSLRTQRDVIVPCILVKPAGERGRSPVVVMVSQDGKRALLKARATEIAELAAAGVAVCLPDVRGVGETSPGDGRARQSYATGLSSSELMHGETVLEQRLFDLRCVLHYLRTRDDLDSKRTALWGDSLAPTNAPDARVLMPRGIDGRPPQCEPLGGTLALLASLYEDELAAIVVRHGVASYKSVLDLPHVFIPHDIVAPGMLKCGDLRDLAAAAAPVPLYVGELVDGANRPLTATEIAAAYETATQAHDGRSAASWLIEQFR
ncbi:MAG: hypothetical protein RIC55_02775 [Pirellulaceae bacterium]